MGILMRNTITKNNENIFLKYISVDITISIFIKFIFKFIKGIIKII